MWSVSQRECEGSCSGARNEGECPDTKIVESLANSSTPTKQMLMSTKVHFGTARTYRYDRNGSVSKR